MKPTFTKKHFEVIAKAINEATVWAGSEQQDGISLTAQYIADTMLHNNPAFNREKFLTACGITQ